MIARDPHAEMMKAFALFDHDQTGKLSFANLRRAATELGEYMNDDEIREMIDEIDRDGDGEIGMEDFIRMLSKTNNH